MPGRGGRGRGRGAAALPPPYSEVDNSSTHASDLQVDSSVHSIIIGVDFGTTFTGVSWVSTEGSYGKDISDIHTIRDWPGPGRDGDYAWKTPTRIAYNTNNTSENSWGFEVLPRMESYAWFKLLLDPEQATKYDDPSLTRSEGAGVLNAPPGKSAVDLSADYLTEVAKFAYQSLAKRVSVEVLQATPVEFHFTVPAVWSDRAKMDTLRAARKAMKQANLKGQVDNKIVLIQEPEAAAVAALSTLTQGGSEQQVKANDSIMICDCGGGTVDITTYVIMSISPKLTFKELLVGTGGKAGSTYIDREFIKWMERKFGTAYTKLPWQKRGPASRLMKDFEGHKRDFGKATNTPYYEVQVNMSEAEDCENYDEDDGIVKIYPADLKSMFDPVVSRITALLQSQLDAERKQSGRVSIKTLILVGGFGDSAYLNQVLYGWCKKASIKLLCPENPQSAIVRGAALSGLHNIQPTSRRSRLHYGWSGCEPFDASRHQLCDMYIDGWSQLPYAKGNMFWELSKGDMVDESTHLVFNFNHSFAEDSFRVLDFTLDLFCSAAEVAPYFERDENSRKLATIKLDYHTVDIGSCESRLVAGRLLRRISCNVVVHFGHRRGTLVFTCTVGNKKVGNATIQFDGQLGADVVDGATSSGAHQSLCATQ